MNIRQTTILSLVLSLLVSVSSVSAFQTSDSDLLEFNGWDHGMIAAGGQSFENVCGDIDAVVTASGDFLTDSQFGTTSGGAGSVRLDAAAPSGVQTFTFSFSEATPIVLDFDLLDPQETITITTDGATEPTYTHVGGLFPSVSTTGTQVRGSAFGNGADGAAFGYFDLGEVTSFTVQYDISGAVNTKFNAFTIGKGVAAVVPEPNAQALLALGFIGLLGMRRKSKRRAA